MASLSAATCLGLLLLTGNTIAAIRRSLADADASATAFAVTSYATLVLLFCSLRLFETSPTGSAARGRARAAVWVTTTLLTAIYTSWGDASSVGFVLLADAALVLLFLCLREFERGGRGRGTNIMATLWTLTAMFSSYATKMAPLNIGALVFLCLRELERPRSAWSGRYAELLKMGFGVVACDSALEHHHQARGDAGSLALVFVAYVGFLTLTWLFLRRFDGHARGAGQ